MYSGSGSGSGSRLFDNFTFPGDMDADYSTFESGSGSRHCFMQSNAIIVTFREFLVLCNYCCYSKLDCQKVSFDSERSL